MQRWITAKPNRRRLAPRSEDQSLIPSVDLRHLRALLALAQRNPAQASISNRTFQTTRDPPTSSRNTEKPTRSWKSRSQTLHSARWFMFLSPSLNGENSRNKPPKKVTRLEHSLCRSRLSNLGEFLLTVVYSVSVDCSSIVVVVVVVAAVAVLCFYM